MMEEPFALTDAERRHPLWLKLKGHLETEIQNARGKLEGDLNEQMTAAYRGRLKALRALVALGDDPPLTD